MSLRCAWRLNILSAGSRISSSSQEVLEQFRPMKQQNLHESLNKEFQDFFEYCKVQAFSKDDMKEICSSLTRKLERKRWKKIGFCLMASVSLAWLCINVSFLNWTTAAFGRMVLIKLLPVWDWTYLYNANCLIPRPQAEVNYETAPPGGLDHRNCALCERLDRIVEIDNASFHYIEEHFLEKGHPVIVTNSHKPYEFSQFVETVASNDGYIETDPCDVESSLMLRRLANLDDLFQKAKSTQESDSWFFHVRNCQFEGVKASRKFTPKPRFHPAHLAPFYSSWLLISSNCVASQKQLDVYGLVMVLQMSGRLEISLTARQPCLEACGQHRVLLDEGEALVYLSDLWELSYSLDGLGHSATIITETKLD